MDGIVFKNIVKEVTKTDFCKYKNAAKYKKNPVKCDDQFVAEIKVNVCILGCGYIKYIINGIYANKKIRNEVDNKLKEKIVPVIALVLESPHIVEYTNGNRNPAMGTTGENLSKYFLKVLSECCISSYNSEQFTLEKNKLLKNGIYRVKLINAIQYQCSLGEDTSKYRDKIFKACWEKDDFREDFNNRLNKDDPILIINCCTGQKKGQIDGLQKLVQEEIDKTNKTARHIYGYHPSTFHFLRGFKEC